MMNSITDTYKLLAALPLLLMTGCASDDSQTDSHQQSVGFTITFGQSTTRADVTTLDNIWPDGSIVTISNGTNTYNYKTPDNSSVSDASVTVSLSPISEEKQFYWPVEDPSWKFTAWFPAGTEPTKSITVSADQRLLTSKVTTGISEADYRAYDLLYCPPTAATFTEFSTVNLQFYHQMTRIIVEINASLTDGETVTNIAFGGGKIGLAGSYTLPTTAGNGQTTWSITDGQTHSVENMRNRSTEAGMMNHNFKFECIVPPQSIAETNLLKISTSGSDEGNKTYYYKKSATLLAGHQYRYVLNISQSGIVALSTLQVINWTTGEPVTNTATIPDNNYPGI